MLAKLKLVKTPKGIDSALMLSALLIIWIGNYTNLDLTIADSMFDAERGHFSGSQNVLASNVSLATSVLAVAAIVLALWDAWRPLAWPVARRTALRVLALSAVLVPVSIYLLSAFSGLSCPGDLLRYGGMESYARLLESMPAQVSAMTCLPTMKAGSPWWLLAAQLFWLPRQPRMAVLVAALMLLCCLAASYLQQLQGTQFFSHALWSAWIAAFLIYLLYSMFKADDALA
ncbi:hypothetical protein [Janthinobacterium sp. GW458P]|uniref:hypothetical protein n=1 Tax=Janthinobacterium sp. GW458P TaxID=1981504 RepID=UPI000A325AE8|nr:hypothetical protein [Janthinobacterium sp. GW458P]MBE3028570.1 acid phosphatase [Janthinobacterium sp. GW458P]